MLVAPALACSNPLPTRGPSDAGTASPDARALQTDAIPAPDLRTPPTAPPATDVAPGRRCAKQSVDSLLVPVRGTVRGPTVEGELCENGMGTFFLDPSGPDGTYVQDFYTNTWLDAPYSPTGYDNSLVYGFLIHAPADANSATLTGWVGATAAEVGTYASTANCGYLDFEVTLPIPPGVVCTYEVGPCDPGCEGYGELFICAPAPARLRYSARPAVVCGTSQTPAQGSWVLTLTSVSPYIPREGYKHHDTHGNLTATLINQADPSDYVVLDLDF